MLKSPLKLVAKTLGFLLIPAVFLYIGNGALAAVGLSVGHGALNLGQTENLYYGNIGAASHASSSFLLFQKNAGDIFKIDNFGNLTTSGAITAGAFSGPITGGSINAANVSAGSFGANLGGGNYSFPAELTVAPSATSSVLRVGGTNITYYSPNQYLEITNPQGKMNLSSSWDSTKEMQFYANAASSTFGSINVGSAFTSGFRLLANGSGLSILPSGNVGVGTTSPSTRFHVYNGDLRTEGSNGYQFTISPGGGSGPMLQLGNASNPEAYFNIGAYGGINNFNSKDRDLKLFTTGGYIYITNGGNVGIGTSTATSRLYVNGGGFFNQPVFVGAPTAATHAATKNYVDSTIASATSSITFWNGASNNIWNVNTGNVGVGITNPSEKLHIQGAFKQTDGEVQHIQKRISTPMTDYSYHYLKLFELPIATTNEAVITISGQVTVLRSNDLGVSGTAEIYASRGWNQYVRHSVVQKSGNYAFSIVQIPDGGKTWVALLYDGHVGPTINNWVLDVDIQSSDDSKLSLQPLVSASAIHSPLVDTQIHPILLSGGNVGIGTTTPLQKLHVMGNIVAGLNDQTRVQINANGGLAEYYASEVTPRWRIFRDLIGSNPGLMFRDGANSAAIASPANSQVGLYTAGTERLRINGSGYVGIGTSTPAATLSVSGGNIFINDWAITGSTPKAAITKEYLDSALSAFNSSNNLWKLNGSNVYSSSTAWNVGIGTTNPTHKLDVSGNVNALTYTISSPAYTVQNNNLTMPAYTDNALGFKSPTKVERWDGSSWQDVTASTTWAYLTDNKPVPQISLLPTYGYDANNARLRIYFDMGGQWISPANQLSLTLQHTNSLNYLKVEQADDATMTTNVGTLKEITTTTNCGDCVLQIPTSGTLWRRYLRIEMDLNQAVAGWEIGLKEIGYYGAPYWGGSRMMSSMIPVDWDYLKNVSLPSDLTISGGDIAINSNNGGVNFSDNSAFWLKTATNWGLYWDTTENQLEYTSGGITRAYVDLDNGNAYYNGTISVATSSLTAKMNVSGGNIFINDWAITGSTPKAAITKEYLDSALSAFNQSTSLWSLNGSNVYTSSTSWNVGIGTAAPETKLDVITGSDTMNTGAVLGSGIRIQSGSGSKSDAYINFWTNSGANTSSYGAGRIRSGWELSPSVAWNDSYIAFQTHAGNDAGWTNDMVIKAGNVGIGTTTPDNKLTIASGDINIIGSQYLKWNSNSGRSIIMDADAAHNAIISAFGNIAFNTYSGTSYNTKVTIQGSTGNMGIGTSNPPQKLTVDNGTILVHKALADDDFPGLAIGRAGSWSSYQGRYADISFTNSNSTSSIMGAIGMTYDGYGRMDFHSFYNGGYDATGPLMSIRGTGNIGIGTTTPGTRLTVVGSGNYSIDAGNFRVGNVAAPVSALDAVNKSYLDSAITGIGSGTDGRIPKWNADGKSLGNSSLLEIGGDLSYELVRSTKKLFATSGNSNWFLAAPSKYTVNVTAGGSPVSAAALFDGKTNTSLNLSSPFPLPLIVEIDMGTDSYHPSFHQLYLLGWRDGMASTSSNNGATITSYKLEVRSVADGLWYTSADVTGVNQTLPFAITPGNANGGYFNAMRLTISGVTGSTWLDTLAYFPEIGMRYSGGASPWEGVGALGITGGNLYGSVVSNSSIQATTMKLTNLNNNYIPYHSSDAVGLVDSNIYYNGTNVGIGTTSPGTKLTVIGSGNYSIDAGNYRVGNVATPVLNLDAANKAYVDSVVGSSTSAITLWGGSAASNIWSLAAGNVGIGTTSPSYKLDVNAGGGSVLGRFYGSNATLARFMLESTIANAQADINFRNPSGNLYVGVGYGGVGANAFIDNRSGGNLAFRNSGSELMTFTTSGSLGIGTSTPSSKLDIISPDSISDINQLRIGSATSNYGTYTFKQRTTSGYANQYLSLDVVNNSGTYLNAMSWSGGNVGIGTTAPTTTLDVVSASNITPLQIKSTGITGTGTIFRAKNGSDVEVLTLLGNGNLGLGSTTPSVKLSVVGSGNYSIDAGNYRLGNVAAPVGNLDAVNRAYVDAAVQGYWSLSGSNLYASSTNWNVGIGKTNPGAKLDVNGTAYFTSIDRIGPASNNTERGTWNPIWSSIASGRALFADEEFEISSNSVQVYNNSGGTALQHFRENGDGSQPNKSGKWIRIVNDNSAPVSPGLGGFVQSFDCRRNATFVQRFRAKVPTGYNLVLAENSQGTGSTSYWLTPVAGTGKWEEYIRVSHCGYAGTFSSSGHVYLTGPAGAVTWYLASVNTYEVDAPTGVFSGKVGVGTANPNSSLHLFNSTVNAELDIQSVIGAGNQWGLYSNISDNSLRVWGGSDYLTVKRDGKIGIGTTVPQSPLEIRNTTNARLTINRAGLWNSSPADIKFNTNDSGANFWLLGMKANSTDDFYLSKDSVDYITIKVGGNVGIGTTTPSSRLYVNGTSIFNDIATFTQPVVVGAPVNPTHAATKNYVDTQISSTTSSITYWNGANNNIWSLNSGNVGIGLTNPNAKLAVNSTITATTTGEQYGMTLSTNFASPDSGLKQGLRLNTTASNTGTLTSLNGILSLITNTGAGQTDGAASIWTRIDAAAGRTVTNAYNLFVNNASISGGATIGNQYGLYVNQLSGATNNFAVYTVGTTPSYFGGNVGIGTTNPGDKLEISGGNLRLGNSAKMYLWKDNDSNYLQYNTWAANTSGNMTIVNAGAGSLNLGVNNTTDLSIITGGDIGVGTTTPTSRLALAGGNIFIHDAVITSGTPKAAITKEYFDSAVLNLWSGTKNGNIWNGDTGQGKVGIGTNDPKAKLHVAGGVVMNHTSVADTDYTVLDDDYVIGFSSINTNRTVTIPNALCTPGRFFVILDESGNAASTRAIIIDPEGTTPIIGTPTFNLTKPYNSVYIFCGNNAWYIL